ncbi:MAG: exonuclease SbcCD subunit D C-terminal domain-containing protein, partial [bacterium]|nr:exonuclease SbcCD subunit D C-terminal domain-containing protein [bacterium]
MNILHTSDWHLGRTLYGHKRYDEFSAFLKWINTIIKENNIDVLLIAGDIFDTSSPSNKAQELYYQFLCTVAHSTCRHIVIISGNHDSPSFLEAPKNILRALNVYVVGAITDNPADEVIVLKDHNDNPEALICAVPYLRDKDLRIAEPGETIADKNSKLIQGLKTHYASVCDVAKQLQSDLKSDNNGVKIPIIGMGHLFAAGGQTVDGDGVRELYVGSLAHVNASLFPPYLDYLALGHLHIPQMVAKNKHIRYSGSPIPMGFGEAKQQKMVIKIHFEQGACHIEEISVPCFQHLVRLTGTLENILNEIQKLKDQKSSAWLEIEYTGQDLIGNLRELIYENIEGSLLEIRRIKNKRIL